MNIGEALTRKLGPLPAWGWGVALGGGILVWRFISGGKSSGEQAADAPTFINPEPGQVAMGNQNFIDNLTGWLDRIEQRIADTNAQQQPPATSETPTGGQTQPSTDARVSPYQFLLGLVAQGKAAYLSPEQFKAGYEKQGVSPLGFALGQEYNQLLSRYRAGASPNNPGSFSAWYERTYGAAPEGKGVYFNLDPYVSSAKEA